MSSEERRKATLGFVGDVCPADNCTPTGSLAEINSTNIADGVGQRFINLMHVDMGDDSYEHGYGELMERECEQPRYTEFLSDGGSMIASIWQPGPGHPNAQHHSQLVRKIVTLDAFTQCPMRTYDITGAKLRWKAIRIDMSAYLL